jgi:hypothetical protein
MPAHNRSGCNQDERFLPSGPHLAQHHPEQLIYRGESTARPFGVQSEQLLTESEIFEDEALSRTKSRDNPAEEMPERRNHGKNLTGTPQIGLVANSLILRVHDVLTNDSWFNDTTTWAPDRSFDVFCHWFDYQHYSMLIDLCDEPLIRERD